MPLFRARETEPEVIISADESAAIDWRRAKPRAFGQGTGVSRNQSLFWARLADLEYIPLLDVVEKALEAHGWELNLENLLFALGTARVGRKSQGVSKGDRLQPVAYEPVYTFELPQKGRSGRLLRMLYAALEPNKKPKKLAQDEGARLRSEQKLIEEMAQLKQEAKHLRAENHWLRESIASANSQVAKLLQEAVSSFGADAVPLDRAAREARKLDKSDAPQLNLGVLHVREIDFDQRVVRLRGEGRSLESSFDELLLFPQKGCQAVGVFENKVLVRLVPIGLGWIPYSFQAAKVLASSGRTAKFETGGRFEFILESDALALGRSSRLRRGDVVVCRFAEGRPVGVCLQNDDATTQKQRLFQIQFEEAVHAELLKVDEIVSENKKPRKKQS